MKYKKAAKLLSLLAKNTEDKNLNNIVRRIVADESIIDAMKKFGDAHSFFGPQGRLLKQEVDQKLNTHTTPENLETLVSELEFLLAKMETIAKETEKNLAKPLAVTSDIEIIRTKDVQKYNTFFLELAGAIDIWFAKNNRVENLNSRSIIRSDMPMDDLYRKVNRRLTEAQSNTPIAQGWKISDINFAGDNLIAFPGFRLEDEKYKSIYERAQKGKYREVSKNIFVPSDIDSNIRIMGIGNISGFSNGLLSEINYIERVISDLSSASEEIQSVLVDPVSGLSKALKTTNFSVTPNTLVEYLNRWRLILSAEEMHRLGKDLIPAAQLDRKATV